MPDPCEIVGVEGEKCDKLHQLLDRPAPKTKRAPSPYNLYVKECIKEKGGIKKFGEAGPIMRQCALEYKEDKAKGKYRYTFEMPKPQAGDSSTLWKGRDLVAEWSNLYGRISGKRKK